MGFTDIGMLKKSYRVNCVVLDRNISCVSKNQIHQLQVVRNSMKASEAIPLKTALIACRISEYAAGGYFYALRKVL